MAGNQLGKTFGGSREVSIHLTGLYPDWWPGRVWKTPIDCWAGSVTSELTRDNVQNKLFGPSRDEWGTGAIPRHCIDFDSITMSRAMGELIDKVRIKHVPTGRWSNLSFKYYQAKPRTWMGMPLDLLWLDEEPPQEIYSEGMTRTNKGGQGAVFGQSGMVMTTATPLLGMTEMISGFYPELSAGKHLTMMSIWDLEGVLYTKDQIAAIVAAYPAHERDARSKGIPMMGSGRVFPVSEDIVKEPWIEPAKMRNWPAIGGCDFGYDHPFAHVSCRLEPLSEKAGEFIFHVTTEYKQRQALNSTNAQAMNDRGAEWMPIAWPHDGHQTDKNSGLEVAETFRGMHCRMLHEHAQFQQGGYNVETGVMEMLEAMNAGRFKVYEGLVDWFREFLLYHRKPPAAGSKNMAPQIVKFNDDLMSATRYAWMMARHAKVEIPRLYFNADTAGMDYDPFGGFKPDTGRPN